MKKINFFSLLFLLFAVTNIYSQINSEKIMTNEGPRFITSVMNYPVYGTYLFEGDKEPMMQLNSNGSGILQDHDLSKSSINWGIECNESGNPNTKKGFNYAVYTLWYKNNNADKGEEWTKAHFSIHFQKKKIFIFGDRIKTYTDDEPVAKY